MICAPKPPPGKHGSPRSTISRNARRSSTKSSRKRLPSVRNAARRLCGKTWLVSDQPVTWNMVHFDVQLIGGMVLHSGRIAEMATGEGKTLVATLPLYLNALTGRGAHLVTVNDYLARRDAEWMGELYRFLGLTCGCIQHDQSPDVRRAQYACDITYGINSELGFDYLRDNGMATSREQQVQRGYVLRHRGRGGFHPDRRGAHAAHHRRPGHGFHAPVRQVQARHRTTRAQAGHACAAAWSTRRKRCSTTARPKKRGVLLFKAKLGQPRNKALLRLLEDPVNRRALDKAELSFYQDTRKDELFALKEELFFTIDERAQESDLSEQGREFLNPDDPEAFVLPDLMTAFADIDIRTDLDDAAKEQAKAQSAGRVRQQGRAHPQHFPAPARLLPLREGRRIRRRGKQGRHRRSIHRPQNAGPPLERRLAPGGRGQGRRADRPRNADAGDDHDPELFPPLPEARRHDGHRRDRGQRVSRHLQARRGGHPDQPRHPPRR